MAKSILQNETTVPMPVVMVAFYYQSVLVIVDCFVFVVVLRGRALAVPLFYI